MSAAGAAALCYHAVGEAAPTFSDDTAVVRLYEAGRRLGEVAHLLGGAPDEDSGALAEVLTEALAEGSGLVAWGLLADAVLPRLLAELREGAGAEEPARQRAGDLVEEARAALGAPNGAEPAWGDAVAALARRLVAAG